MTKPFITVAKRALLAATAGALVLTPLAASAQQMRPDRMEDRRQDRVQDRQQERIEDRQRERQQERQQDRLQDRRQDWRDDRARPPAYVPPRPVVPRGAYIPRGHTPGYWNGRPYYEPRGYTYRRWVTGQVLPRAYWTMPYWFVNDWRAWRLPSYRSGYRWIRVGPDALLINLRTGRIVRVVYRVFW